MSKWSRAVFKDIHVPAAEPDTSHHTRSASKRSLSALSSPSKTAKHEFKRPLPPTDLNSEPWVELFAPSTSSELAVHPNKVAEFREWLNSALDDSNPKASKMCLLSGPSGSGKTATVTTVCSDLNISVDEWSNGSEIVAFNEDFRFGEFRPDLNQRETFFKFIVHKSQRNLCFDDEESRKSVILVEEFPNAIVRLEDNEFAQFLESVAPRLSKPVIFVVSEDPGSSTSRRNRNLFPESLTRRANLKKIDFNPVAPTFLAKAMNRVIEKVESSSRKGSSKFVKPSEESVGALAELSNGDIRLCINGLQFACAASLVGKEGAKLFSVDVGGMNESAVGNSGGGRGRRKKGTVKGMKEKLHNLRKRKMNSEIDGSSSVSFPLGDRDGKLDLFSVLGKILYAKRDTDDEAVRMHRQRAEDQLSETFFKLEPGEPLLENPENLVTNSSLSPDGLVLFLHQNYPAFFNSPKALANVAGYFSTIDSVMGEDWTAKDAVTNSCCSFLVRGLMHERYPELKSGLTSVGGRMHKFSKPKLRSAVLDEERNRAAVRSAFTMTGSVIGSDELFAVHLPLLRLRCLGKSDGLLERGQKEVLEVVTKFSGVGGGGSFRGDQFSTSESFVEDDYFQNSEPSSSSFPSGSQADDRGGGMDGVELVPSAKSGDLVALIEDFDDDF